MKTKASIDESSSSPSFPVGLTRTRLWVLAASLTAMLITIGLTYFAWKQLPELPIREVVFSGEIRHARTDRLHALALGMRGSLWRIDLAEVREAVRQVPWVREVTVQRRFPARLEIHVEEHQPFAYWEAEEPMLVNTFGEVFHAGFDTDSPSLPVLSGPPDSAAEVVKKYGEFTRMLESTGRHPVAVRLSARRAWQVSLDNGAWLELGRNEQDSRLARLVRAWPKVAALQAGNMHIDVRYANGFALRRSTGTERTDSNKG